MTTSLATVKFHFETANKEKRELKITQSNPNPLGGFVIDETHVRLVQAKYKDAAVAEHIDLIQAALDLGVNPANDKLLMLFPSKNGRKVVYLQIALKRLLIRRYFEVNQKSSRKLSGFKFYYLDGGPHQDKEDGAWYDGFWLKPYPPAICKIVTKIGEEDVDLSVVWRYVQRYAEKGGAWAERPDQMMAKAVESKFYDLYFADILAGNVYDPQDDPEPVQETQKSEPVPEVKIIKTYEPELVDEDPLTPAFVEPPIYSPAPDPEEEAAKEQAKAELNKKTEENLNYLKSISPKPVKSTQTKILEDK